MCNLGFISYKRNFIAFYFNKNRSSFFFLQKNHYFCTKKYNLQNAKTQRHREYKNLAAQRLCV